MIFTILSSFALLATAQSADNTVPQVPAVEAPIDTVSAPTDYSKPAVDYSPYQNLAAAPSDGVSNYLGDIATSLRNIQALLQRMVPPTMMQQPMQQQKAASDDQATPMQRPPVHERCKDFTATSSLDDYKTYFAQTRPADATDEDLEDISFYAKAVCDNYFKTGLEVDNFMPTQEQIGQRCQDKADWTLDQFYDFTKKQMPNAPDQAVRMRAQHRLKVCSDWKQGLPYSRPN